MFNSVMRDLEGFFFAVCSFNSTIQFKGDIFLVFSYILFWDVFYSNAQVSIRNINMIGAANM